jgi:hypothetical protein
MYRLDNEWRRSSMTVTLFRRHAIQCKLSDRFRRKKCVLTTERRHFVLKEIVMAKSVILVDFAFQVRRMWHSPNELSSRGK